jgi:transcriptional regulator with XRE-family HTH domain
MQRQKPRKSGAASTKDLAKELGARLRESREKKQLSVRALARYLGMSPAMISQIELGQGMPSVATLYAITNQLKIGIDELFKDADDPPAQIREQADIESPVQSIRTRKIIKLAKGIRWERLTPKPDPDIEFYWVVYDVGAESCPKDSLIRHGGIEYGCIIRGRLGIKIGFEEYTLEPGDSISFDPQVPHRQWTIGRQPAEAIWVVNHRHSDTRQITES